MHCQAASFASKGRTFCASASIVSMILIFMSGCAQIRLVTYPDSFVWIDANTVRSTMHSMAASLRAIDNLITSETTVGEHKDRILIELNALESTAQSLAANKVEIDENGVGHVNTNHLVIDEHLDEFTESVLLAKLQIQTTPLNYYRAGTLIGSCNACHQFR